MNCLDYQTPQEYFKTLDNMAREELENEYKKNFYLLTNIELKYNVVRSRLFLEFFEPTNYFLHKTHRYTIKTIKKAVCDCISWCSTYIDITSSLVGHSFRKELLEEIEIPNEELIQNTKVLCLRAFRYFNTLVELCVSAKNHLLFLSKKVFNKVSYPEINQVFFYDDELTFESEEEIENFEKNTGIERKENEKEIIKEVYESLLSEIYLNDKMFQVSYVDDMKSLYGQCTGKRT